MALVPDLYGSQITQLAAGLGGNSAVEIQLVPAGGNGALITLGGSLLSADPDNSSVLVSSPYDASNPASVLGNNFETVTVDVYLQAADGITPVPNKTVTLSFNQAGVFADFVSLVTDASGHAQFNVRSQTCSINNPGLICNITAVDVTDGVTLTQVGQAYFAFDPAQSSTQIVPVPINANGIDQAVITATAKDNLGNPVNNALIAWKVNNVTHQLTSTNSPYIAGAFHPPPCDIFGVTTFDLETTLAQTVQVLIVDAIALANGASTTPIPGPNFQAI